MAGVNKVILIGNLGKDPDVRTLETGVKVASFRLATTERFTGKSGEKTEHTEWHNIVAWRGLAEIAEKFLRKGNTVYIEGRLRTREWEDKDNNKRFTTEILADNMTMLGGRRDQGDEGSHPAGNGTSSAQIPDDNVLPQAPEDDLPF